jgi:hypothetical protein
MQLACTLRIILARWTATEVDAKANEQAANTTEQANAKANA